MPEFVLKQKTALNEDRPFSGHWDGFSVSEITGQHVWWAGVSADGEAALLKAAQSALDCAIPAANRFSDGKSDGSAFRIVSAGNRQFFIMGEADKLPGALEAALHVTDQSDGWVGIRMEGSATREVLSRLCSLDFHPTNFAEGHAARVPFEGMLALIACENVGEGRYSVYFQSSSARSFVGHVSHAATSVCGPSTSGGH